MAGCFFVKVCAQYISDSAACISITVIDLGGTAVKIHSLNLK